MTRHTLIILALFILLLFWVLVFLPRKTEASSENRLVLVQGLLGEAGYRPANDHPSILHVLERRRHLPKYEGLSLTDMARKYAKFLSPYRDKNSSPHRRGVFALTLETAPGWTIKLVDRFLEDPENVPDPCRGKAWHWGSYTDVQKSKRKRVNCGKTYNIFLSLREQEN